MGDESDWKIYKVIQWSSGNVGKASIRGICNRSDLELVGLIVSDEKKNGLDGDNVDHYYTDPENRYSVVGSNPQ